MSGEWRGPCPADEATITRGACRVFASEDEWCVSKACEMCGLPCARLHIHVLERHPELDPSGMPPALRWAAAFVQADLERKPMGMCSEACAIRYVNGRPTSQERLDAAGAASVSERSS